MTDASAHVGHVGVPRRARLPARPPRGLRRPPTATSAGRSSTAFNYATDWFDVLADEQPGHVALWIVEEDGSETTPDLRRAARRCSQRLAGYLDAAGVSRGDRVLLLLGNCAAALGVDAGLHPDGRGDDPGHHAAVRRRPGRPPRARRRRRPSSPGAADAAKFGPETASLVRVSVGDAPTAGCPTTTRSRRTADAAGRRRHRGRRPAAALLHLAARRPSPSWSSTRTRRTRSATCRRCTGSACSRATCTSTSRRRAGPSTPGRASSRPGTPARPIVIYNYARFDAEALLDVMERVGVTTFCAPPTVWRMITQASLGNHSSSACASASAPASRSTPR